jgi:hypothetical protein
VVTGLRIQQSCDSAGRVGLHLQVPFVPHLLWFCQHGSVGLYSTFGSTSTVSVGTFTFSSTCTVTVGTPSPLVLQAATVGNPSRNVSRERRLLAGFHLRFYKHGDCQRTYAFEDNVHACRHLSAPFSFWRRRSRRHFEWLRCRHGDCCYIELPRAVLAIVGAHRHTSTPDNCVGVAASTN